MGGIVVVVEENEVDIRTRGQLEGAELAHAHHGHAPARIWPMRRLHLREYGIQGRFNYQIGKMGEGAGGDLATDRACQQPHADEKALLGGENTEPVENILVVAGIGEEIAHALGKIFARRHVAHQRRVQHAVKNMRAGGDDFGKARGRRHDRHQQRQQRLIVAEQREELDARR